MIDHPTSSPDTEGPTSEEVLESGRLRRAFVADVLAALHSEDTDSVQTLVEQLHPADIADLIEVVDAADRGGLIAALGAKLDGDVIAELNDWVREEVLRLLTPADLAGVVTDLETDDAVAILQDLDAEDQQEVLKAIAPEERVAIEDALTYPDDAAGRIMQRDVVTVPEYWTVGQVIDSLRESTDLATDFWEIFVVDPQHRPIGTIRLSWMLRTIRSVLVSDVMQREQILIPAAMDREEVALRFQKYALISAPVIDASGRLVGVITVDDVLHIIAEEAQEDIMRLAGAGDADINEPVRDAVRSRMRWLVINLCTAVLSSIVIGVFADTIAHLVALAILMPIVSALGGNAGTQTMTVAVRALALNQLSAANAARIVWKEVQVAFWNGSALAVLAGGATALYFHNPMLGLVFGVAMMSNILLAGLVGVLYPLTLDRLRIDPAVASTVFVTVTTDVMGFAAFLGLAALSGIAGGG